jgi:cobaltochelatase CobT
MTIMSDQSPLDTLKSVLAGAARAMAHEPEIELAFTADAPTQSGKNFRVPMPGRSLPADQVAEARGFADGMALRLRHHNDAVHALNRPGDATAGAVFDAIEAARVEALGAKAMEGVRANLSHALSMRMRSDPIARALAVDEVPLSSAVGLLVRERLTGEAPPTACSAA